MQKKRTKQRPEDFVGWKSDDGLLEVVDIYGKQGSTTTYKVVCHKCKEDKELFPLGYFVSRKVNLMNRNKPCGCARYPKWSEEQFLVLARRAAKDRLIVHGFSEEFHGQKTKVNLECLVDGYKWIASIQSVMKGRGCSKCSYNAKRTSKQEALDKCKAICKTEGYKPVGFVGDYKNNQSRFEYECPIHGKQNVSYIKFVSGGTRCKDCAKERRKELGNGNGYYYKRKDEQDFLYVLNFDNNFIKVGRSFNIGKRLKRLRDASKIKIQKIHKLRIFTATHQEIYDTEQEILEELRERGFQYYVEWSKECFENECLFILNELLDNYMIEEIQLQI